MNKNEFVKRFCDINFKFHDKTISDFANIGMFVKVKKRNYVNRFSESPVAADFSVKIDAAPYSVEIVYGFGGFPEDWEIYNYSDDNIMSEIVGEKTGEEIKKILLSYRQTWTCLYKNNKFISVMDDYPEYDFEKFGEPMAEKVIDAMESVYRKISMKRSFPNANVEKGKQVSMNQYL